MNKELYEELKNELNSLSGEYSDPHYVGSHFLAEKSNGKTGKDKFTVIYSFHEYMNNKEEYYFIKQGGWAEFYQRELSEYLTYNNIKLNFDEIVKDENLLDTILEVCNDDVIKDFYNCANAKSLEMQNHEYDFVQEKIKNEMIRRGFIQDNIAISTSIPNQKAELDKIRKEQEELERKRKELEKEQEERRNDLFNGASKDLGVKPETLMKKVGDDSLNIDKIVIDESLLAKLSSPLAKAATMPNSVFSKIKQKINSSRMLRKTSLDIVEKDNMKTLTLSKKETIFDKIASSDNDLVRAIYNSAKRKAELLKMIVKPSDKVKKAVKKSLVNTNEKVKTKITSVKENTKNSINLTKENINDKVQNTLYNAVLGISDAQYKVQEKIDDTKQNIENKKQEIASNAAKKLFNLASKIDPNVVLNAGTKVGTIKNPLLLEESTGMSLS